MTTHDGKESSKVLDTVLLGVTDQETAHNGDDRVERNEDATLSKLVRKEGDNKGVDGTGDIRRRRKEKSELVRVSLSSENDRQKVGEGVTLKWNCIRLGRVFWSVATYRKGGAHEAETKAPGPPIEYVSHDLGLGHLVGYTISAILVDSFDDESALIFVQESRLVGEVDNEDETESTECDCDDTEEEKDPSPGVELTSRFHEGETVTNDVGEARNRHG